MSQPRREQRTFGSGSGFLPEGGFNAEFVHRLNETAEVMRQHFAEGFVHLSGFGFAAEAIPELGLDH